MLKDNVQTCSSYSNILYIKPTPINLLKKSKFKLEKNHTINKSKTDDEDTNWFCPLYLEHFSIPTSVSIIQSVLLFKGNDTPISATSFSDIHVHHLNRYRVLKVLIKGVSKFILWLVHIIQFSNKYNFVVKNKTLMRHQKSSRLSMLM